MKKGPYAMLGETQRGLFGAIVTVRPSIVTLRRDRKLKPGTGAA
jgi:hypothetical protein